MTRCDDVLIVIPCLDEATHLPALIEAMVSDAPGALVVVADGGSRDASRAIAAAAAERHRAVRLLDNPARLQAAAVNAAVRRHGSGRRWLVRVDAHCGYPPGYVAALVASAKRRDVVGVVVPLRTRGRGCFGRAAAAAQNALIGTGGSAHRHPGGAGRYVDHGHHALMAIDAFAAAGGYCEAQSHNEDAELDHRLARAGGRLWLEPACTVEYHPRETLPALVRQYRRYGAGRARTIRRHRLRPRLRQLLPLGTVAAVAMLPLAPFAWWCALPALLWLAVTLGSGIVLGARERSLCACAAGVAAAAMHLAWGLGFAGEWLSRPARADDPAAPALSPGLSG